MATPVIMPRQGQSVESCILGEWLVNPGDAVTEGQILASYETDKASFELESPAAGILLETFFAEGEDIPVLTHIAVIGEAGEEISALRPEGGDEPAPANDAAPPAPAPTPAVTPAAQPGAGISPRARNLAAVHALDASGLAGSGPAGRVIERDIQAVLANAPRLSPAARAAIQPGLAAPATGSGPAGMVLAADLQAGLATPPATALPTGEPKEIKLTGIRKLIADRMLQSLATTAQLTLTRTVDARALQAYRAKVKAGAESRGLPNITLNDMIVLATARVLMRHPDLNAHFLGDRIVQFPYANIGIAVDTPRGLMVPVLSNAQALSLSQVSSGIRPMAEACQAGNVNPDLLTGGTFTITNLGVLGIETFTPVLNVPQVAILGVGGLILKPVQGAGGIEHVPAITLSLTINHQVVDGAPAARFLKDLAEGLESFDLLLAE